MRRATAATWRFCSTACTRAAPCSSASQAMAPLPLQRSSQRQPRSRGASTFITAWRTMAVVGRAPRPGGLCRR
ncbi:MAG: hypothetical protein EBU30_02255 [Synechococcaceae bacterium WB6_3B_236]|nr:hypothetical protein [Synechococcaceae bacterium WB6_3B_236]